LGKSTQPRQDSSHTIQLKHRTWGPGWVRDCQEIRENFILKLVPPMGLEVDVDLHKECPSLSWTLFPQGLNAVAKVSRHHADKTNRWVREDWQCCERIALINLRPEIVSITEEESHMLELRRSPRGLTSRWLGTRPTYQNNANY
jgi:hypothetical protein